MKLRFHMLGPTNWTTETDSREKTMRKVYVGLKKGELVEFDNGNDTTIVINPAHIICVEQVFDKPAPAADVVETIPA